MRALCRYAVATIAVIVALFAAGCSSPTSVARSSPSTATSMAPFCPAAEQLKTSVTDLRKVNVISGGLPAVQQALGTIQTNLNEFQTAAQTQFGPEVSQLRTSLSGLQTALQSAQSSPSATTVASVITSISGVVSSYTALQTAVSNRCG